MTEKDYVIIGGGSAGFSAIKAIREENPTSQIYWISNEDRTPYKRTHINKNITKGFDKNEFALVEHDWLVNNKIQLLFDNVLEIDTDKHELSFSDRGHLRYKKLIIATGQLPREINIQGLDEIEHVYTARQVENIVRKSKSAKNILIIGAGVEGIETANQLIASDKNIVLVDKNTDILQQYFNPLFSELMKTSITNAGIELILNVNSLEYNTDSNEMLINGEARKFDLVISSIGYKPNIDLAIKSGIECNKGILVNALLETSAKDVYAAGDVAEHPNGQITGLWHAAEQQGYIAAKNACGKSISNELPPFRMKTQVFNEFYFSLPPKDKAYTVITEEQGDIIRELYFFDNKLDAALMKNDKSRAKMYQKALLEAWSLEQVKANLAL